MKKGIILNAARQFGLMHLLDKGRYFYLRAQNAKKNKLFKRSNPDVNLPPDYLIYESFQMDYKKYYTGGKEVAIWLNDIVKPYHDINNLNVLDWGCGPARVLRHMPEVMNNGCKFYGTDYNSKTISWCKSNISNINFSLNGLKPPLEYDDIFFGLIYGISVFTHLSEDSQKEWFAELIRISGTDGIIFLTTQGDAFIPKLTPKELKIYNDAQLVIRSNVKEGHRVFSSFHPPAYMTKLFNSYATVLKFIPGEVTVSGQSQQDVWVLTPKN